MGKQPFGSSHSLTVGLVTLTVPSLAMIFVALELFFTYLLPAAQVPFVYFEQGPGILRFDADGPRTGLNTIGNFAQQRGRWRVNNLGWSSSIDYELTSERDPMKPLIALIGDSYIAALQVDHDRNIASNLRRLGEDRVDVYSFGMSGAPLSQYLHVSRYVRDRFDPDVFVVNVVRNDFDESIRAYHPKSYFMQLELSADQVRELPPKPYSPSRLRRMLGKSSIVRFLLLNLKAQEKLNRILFGVPEQANVNVDFELVSSRMAEIRMVTEYVIRTLMTENQGRAVVFLFDAPRQDLYAGRLDPDAPPELHAMFSNVCDAAGAICLDLIQEFSSRYRQTGQPYNTEYDGHWNEVGHKVAAEALFKLLRSHHLFRTQAVTNN